MAGRTIVQYGVYRFTPEEKQGYRIRVCGEVIRIPGNRYLNLKYPKEEGFYGYAQLMAGDFVAETVQLSYEKQIIFEFTQSDLLYTLYSSSQYSAIIQSIGNLASAMGFPLVDADPYEYDFFPLPFDRVVIRLFNDTTYQVFTEVLPLPEVPNLVPLFDEASDDPPDPSGVTPTPNPLDPGYDIPSPAYDPSTNDDGETYNPPRPEPTQGEPGTQQIVRIEYRLPYFYDPPYNPLIIAQTTLTAPIRNYRLREEGRPNAPVWILEVPYGSNQIWSAASGGITPPSYSLEQFVQVENFTVTPVNP